MDKRHLMAFKVSSVVNKEEYSAHQLEVVYSHLKLRQLNEAESKVSNGTQQSTPQGVGKSSTKDSFGQASYDMVFKLIKGCRDEEGVAREAVHEGARGRLSAAEVDKAVDFLSNEGHIYSTIDEDHFKSTDDE